MISGPSFTDNFGYRLFGNYARKNRATYFDLELYLRKANIAVPLEIYVSRMLLISAAAGVAVSILSLFTAILIKLLSPEGTFVPWHRSADAGPLLQAFSSEPFLLVLIFCLSFLIAYVATYLIYRNYPLYRSSVRESSINQMLPHAVTFLHAMSSGGMNLLDIFRTINQHRDIYGEVTYEFQSVVQGVDLLGLDLITSLRQAASNTPSDHLKSFLESTATHMESGGDLAKFLRARSDQFQVVAAQERKALMEMLGMLAEVYITAFVAGPVFLITILIAMGMVSSSDPGQLDLLVYVAIPLGSVMFIWLLIAMGLESSNTKVIVLRKQIEEFTDTKKVEDSPKARSLIGRAALRYRIRRFLDNPVTAFVNKPHQLLYVTVPIAAVIFIVLSYPHVSQFDFNLDISHLSLDVNFSQSYFNIVSIVDDYLLLAAAIAFVPFIVCWELRSNRIGKMDAAIPEFLKRLASFNESGLTLAMAIKALLNSNLGVLNAEIRKIWTDIEWGADAKEALIRFEYRVNTASIRRVVTLITKASESSGDIKETLSIAAADASASQSEREERFLNMLLYVSIIYISFFVFLYILYTLGTVFLPVAPAVPISQQLGSTASAVASTGVTGGINVQLYEMIFLHAVLIQGLFSGLVAGMMGEGNVYSGLKHSAIMMSIGYIVFMLFM